MKYEFASPLWLAALHGIIAERAAAESRTRANLAMSVCEVFVDAPLHLADASGRIAWSCIVRGGAVDFRYAERDDVAVKLVSDYAAAAPTARYEIRGDAERARELNAMLRESIRRGKLKIFGAPITGPAAMTSVHDTIVRLTA